jgi:hypothetical protein
MPTRYNQSGEPLLLVPVSLYFDDLKPSLRLLIIVVADE